jgi:hypothetical protein
MSAKAVSDLFCVEYNVANKTDVAMLGFFASLHTTASIVQQIHTIVRWRDIKTEQHANIVANAGDPELNITGASTGLDLVLFYIQYYAYNVEALLVLFWYAAEFRATSYIKTCA